MAIQVSGTQVIGNSRELTNIASVDATTAASITAAGVGGGGTIDLVADGSITAGDIIGLTSAGKAKTVTAMAGSKLNLATTEPPLNYSAPFIYDSTANVFVAAWRGVDNNYVPRLIAVNNSSGLTLSKGSVVNGGPNYAEWSGPQIMAHGTTHGKNLITVREGSSTRVQAFTCSGTTITLGSVISVSQTNNGNSLIYYDPDQNNFPHFCRAGANGINSNIFTTSSSNYNVSSTSSTAIISSGSMNPGAAAYDTVNNKGLLLYKDGSGHLQGRVVTNSGSSLSLGAEAKIWDQATSGSFETDSVQMAYDATAGSFVVTLAAGSTGTPPFAKALSISGTTINQGSWIDLTVSLGALQGNYPAVSSDGAGNFLLSSNKYPNETHAFAAASGTSLAVFPSFELPNYTLNTDYQRPVMAYSPDTGNFVKFVGKGSNGGNMFVYAVSGSSPLPRSIGFASSSVSNGSTVTVDILSGKNTSQSGLSSGVPYGVNALTGGILAGGTPSLGMALSSTSILITGTYF